MKMVAKEVDAKEASGTNQAGRVRMVPPTTYQSQKLLPKETLPCQNFLISFFICDASVTRPILTPHLRLEKLKLMAERVGFEPTVPLTVHKLSKPAPIF